MLEKEELKVIGVKVDSVTIVLYSVIVFVNFVCCNECFRPLTVSTKPNQNRYYAELSF